jgi:hypothetical protein
MLLETAKIIIDTKEKHFQSRKNNSTVIIAAFIGALLTFIIGNLPSIIKWLKHLKSLLLR